MPTEDSGRCTSVDLLATDYRGLWAEDQKLIHEMLHRIDGLNPDTTAETLTNELASGASQLFLLVDRDGTIRGAVVTALAQYETGYEVLMVRAVATRGTALPAREMRSIMGKLELVARNFGCDAVRFTGRLGWMRVLPDYEATAVVYDKPIREVH